MMKLTDKKYIKLIIFLCSALYFVSYMTRINYQAVLVEITKSLGVEKSAASLALTLSAISYGSGQLISGYLGDKFKPDKIILSGLICTTIMNILIPFCPTTGYMAVVWFINGFAQSMMWPPIVKIMTSMLTEDDYKKGCIKVSCASSVATILIYLTSPVIIYCIGWKGVFGFSAVLSIAMCFLWTCGYKATKKQLKEVETSELKSEVITDHNHEKFTFKVVVILAIAMFTIILQGALRDGVSTWMPTYISESFGLGSEISILTNVLLPIFSIFCYQIASWLNRKVIHNEFLCVATTFGLTIISAVALSVFGNSSVALAIIIAAVLNASSHATNYIQTCLLPIYFTRYGKVSFISGLLNSCTYMGTAVSIYGIALLTTAMSWSEIALVWAFIAAVGLIITFAFSKMWNKLKKGEL